MEFRKMIHIADFWNISISTWRWN